MRPRLNAVRLEVTAGRPMTKPRHPAPSPKSSSRWVGSVARNTPNITANAIAPPASVTRIVVSRRAWPTPPSCTRTVGNHGRTRRVEHEPGDHGDDEGERTRSQGPLPSERGGDDTGERGEHREGDDHGGRVAADPVRALLRVGEEVADQHDSQVDETGSAEAHHEPRDEKGVEGRRRRREDAADAEQGETRDQDVAATQPIREQPDHRGDEHARYRHRRHQDAGRAVGLAELREHVGDRRATASALPMMPISVTEKINGRTRR